MGFFDFLKDLDIKAPEQEPQRGTLIQTDKSGRIETDQIGTPTRPQSRIVSRDEFRDRERDKRNLYDVSNDPEMRAVAALRGLGMEQDLARQAMTGQEPNFLSGIDAFRAGAAMQGRAPVDIGIQPNKNYVPMSMVYGPQGNLKTFEFKGATTPDRFGNITDLPVPAPDDPRGYDFQNQSGSIMGTPEYSLRRQFPVEQFRDNTAQRPPLGEPSEEVKNLANQYILDADDMGGYSLPYSQALQMARDELSGRTSMDEASFGGNMVGTASQVPAFTTQAYTGSQPKQGITSFADAKKEIIQGKQEGIKQLSPLQKIMAPIRNFVGRAMNYETDDQGRLTMKGIADMEADKQRSQAIYAENQRQRNLDRDRAMRMAQTQQQPVAQPPVQEEGIKNLFERNPESLQAYLNRFRPPNITGNVPLTMYGQVGGEYDFFKRAEGGQALQKQPTGEVVGVGGPKDDLVGPILLSNKEYVLPHEQIKMYGGGDYETGVKRLEQDRMNALTNFA